MKPAATWAALIGAPVVYDIICDRRSPDSTLSHLTRVTFRTDTLPGRIAFVAAWCGLSRWFVPHILKR